MPVGLSGSCKDGASTSNRYSPNNERGQLIKAIAQIENVPEDHIMSVAGLRTKPWSLSDFRVLLAHQYPWSRPIPAMKRWGRAANFLKVPIKYVLFSTAAYKP